MSIQKLQELISPKFDEAVVIKIIETYSGLKEIQIIEINTGEATSKGDSYLSNVTRICIDAKGTTESGKAMKVTVPIIVKSLPKNIGRRKTFRSSEFFENEVIFYEKVWSELRNFQKLKNIKKPFENVPLFLSGLVDGENDYIALEDLSYKGFRCASRGENLEYDHLALIMRLFGRFHGLSYAYKQQNPQAFEKMASSLKETYFSEKHRGWYEKFQKKLIAIVRDAVEQELPNEYLTKFDECMNGDFFGLVCRLAEIRGPFSVITHGDSWLPNFLLKYDETGLPLDSVMIDFQLTRYSSFSNDLLFFLYVTSDEAMREKHWDDLIVEYHKAFTDIVKQLGTDPQAVTLDALNKDIKQYGAFGLGMGVEALVMSLLDDDQISDLDSIQGDEQVPIESVWMLHPLETAEKRRRVADMVKHSVDQQYI